MKLGFHVSIAGGFRNVVTRAKERQCETIQLFTRNPRGWKYNPLDAEDISIFKHEMKTSGIGPVFVHMPYLANLATTRKGLLKRSLDSLGTDLKRSALIGAPFLIMHIGSAQNVKTGLERISRSINRVLSRVPSGVKLLLENTAGSGAELGHSFEQLRKIIDKVEQSARIGVVLDTAHAFAAGYDLRTEAAVASTLTLFDQTIGYDRLCLVHLNDSKTECDSHSDRHWHIGKGKIGHGMYHILHYPALQNLPFIMETPRTNLKEDLMNMKKVRKLLVQPKRPRKQTK
ncbi:deoxyribonuclease IV [candidate division WOR-3 bacterium]|nr:deoxyribonuclease IV [candidate division WOR-3 bacterium]